MNDRDAFIIADAVAGAQQEAAYNNRLNALISRGMHPNDAAQYMKHSDIVSSNSPTAAVLWAKGAIGFGVVLFYAAFADWSGPTDLIIPAITLLSGILWLRIARKRLLAWPEKYRTSKEWLAQMDARYFPR